MANVAADNVTSSTFGVDGADFCLDGRTGDCIPSSSVSMISSIFLSHLFGMLFSLKSSGTDGIEFGHRLLKAAISGVMDSKWP
eukprot:CAMPEP_0170198190 /NCGR_PEP_ID=MMETSP0040_2-20121228/68168_1 /TAXON_ID=641309 /ORGANISM="Lotharella oceanica, Strain CCMP622" /LENGTH=82 /DNA_ID=CAMNT_0010448063 /DNA_START=444 /DNA_END=692 /DNA_ORIENTATION=+